MELTDTELAGMATMLDAASWAALGGRAKASLFELLGVEDTTPVRNIGILPKDDYMAIIRTWLIPAPTPADAIATVLPNANQVGQAGLMGRACKVKCGTEPNHVTASTPASAHTAKAADPPTTKRIKLSNTIDQANVPEQPMLAKDDIQAAFARYKQAFGDYTPAEEEPTDDQITALKAVVDAKAPPYVDFSV